MKEKFELYFERLSPVRLETARLSLGEPSGVIREVVSRWDGAAHPQEAHFRWGRGMKTLCLGLLRMKLGPQETTSKGRPLFSGMAGSPAATLDNLVHKAGGMNWLREMLSLGGLDARTRLQGWFERQNSQGNNRGRPIRIFAGCGARALMADQITVWLEGRVATGNEVAGLESGLAKELGEDPWLVEKKTEVCRRWGSLPGAGGRVVGRETELAMLDAAISEPGCRIFQIVAAGGFGKTALAESWLEKHLPQASWKRVFVWSFYRQGFTSDSVQPLWPFRKALAELLGVELGERASAGEMVTALHEGFCRESTLLVLDGMEAILHGPGDQEGQLRDDVLPEFFKRILEVETGFCLLTSRVAVGNLEGLPGSERLALPPLGRENTRRLLRELEVTGLPTDLEKAVDFSQGHPLLIRLLAARFVSENLPSPNPSPLLLRSLLRDLQKLSRWKDSWTQEDPALTRMLRSYLRWFGGMPELALLQFCAIFDRLPEETALLTLLADIPALGGEMVVWQDLPLERWQLAARKVRECGLAFPGNGLVLEMHPLVQTFFIEEWKRGDRASYRAAHRLLYVYFKAVPEKELPDTLEEMQPLFQAVHHGCQAGDYQKTFEEIAWRRLSRGLEAYIITHLGAFQETRALMGFFLAKGWDFPEDSDLLPETKGAILQAVAHCERVQERLDTAILLLRRCVRWVSKGSDPTLAVAACFHIIRMAMTRGRMKLGLIYCLRLRYLTLRHPKFFLTEPQNALERDITAFFSGILACFLLISGRKKDGEPILQRALEIMRQDYPDIRFLPRLSMQFHAFWLIETGQNSLVLEAIEKGETEFSSYQYEFNNTAALIKGLAWTRQAIDAGQPPEVAHIEKTEKALDEAVQQARNFGRWLLLADALVARARWLLHFGREKDFLRDLNQCREIAVQYGFGLILTDISLLATEHQLRIGLCREAAESHNESARLVKRYGYKLRNPTLISLYSLIQTELETANKSN